MTTPERLFVVTQPVIAMVHLPALPGRPRHDRSDSGDVFRMVDVVGRDLIFAVADGVAWNAVDPDRARRMIAAASAAREKTLGPMAPLAS